MITKVKEVLIISLLVVLITQNCQMKNSNSKLQPIDSLFQSYHEESLKMYPLNATMLGDKRYNDTLPNDISQEFIELEKRFYTKYRNALELYDRNTLSTVQKMSYDVLKWQCEISLEKKKYPTYLTPIDQFWSLNIAMGQMAGGRSLQPFKTVEDYDNWVKRVDDYMLWCDTAMANMRKGMELGYVLPKALILKIIPQMEKFAHGPVDNHIFYKPVIYMPETFSTSERKKITDSYSQMIEEKVIPKYKEMHLFFKDEYLHVGRESSGISELPLSDGYYQHMIKYYTNTDLTADEIFELGKKEVARITQEMIELKDSVGFEGDIKSFIQHVKTKDELKPFDRPEQVIDNFNQIHVTMKPKLDELFDLVPKTPFEVRRTEAFREKTASAEYNPGSVDGTRPGIFYVPIPNVKKYNIFSDEDLFLHEAIPGHHYQISLQQENPDLPDFRKLFWNSAFGEGWCLYCESLGRELGLYTDPYQYFGMLSAEMHRAIRLVVDVGIHDKGWTREQAIQYSLDHEAESESSIIAEIERYMAMPGQALSYKIGQLKVLELRAKAEKELGDKFSIKEFHNQMLDAGCLPLYLYEEKINNWIQKVSNETAL